jgi:signal transduction histidine kinase/CheY-like chemotaxis protein
MSRTQLVTMKLAGEQDIVLARQRARQVARLVGFERQAQTSIATAVSEIARNTVSYAGGGKLAFSLVGSPPRQRLEAAFEDSGPGIADLQGVLDGSYVSPTGMGVGIAGTRRLMDEFDIRSVPGQGTTLAFGKYLPGGRGPAMPVSRVVSELLRAEPGALIEEVLGQNRDLLASMADLETARGELNQANAELESTNRGVLALYAELDQRAEDLKRASEAKSQFLSAVSHELRTPLNAITALARMLADQADGPLNEEQQRQVFYLRQAADTLTRLVNDLLDLAKVESGRVDLHATDVAMPELLGALRGIMRPLQSSDRVRLVFDDTTGGMRLHTDEGKLSQILRNLLSNALKYTEEGEVRVTVSGPVEGRVAFAVSDTGIGIPDDERHRIFEEFVQLRNPLQKRTTGSGLGLPLSRRFAELLGGFLTVESELGRGSTFTVEIPAVLPGSTAPDGAEQVGQPKILIIEDEQSTRYVLRHMLEAEGDYELLEAEDGTEGLRLAQAERPDLVLLDLNLPQLNGFEVFKTLKGDPATSAIPILVLTASLLAAGHGETLQGAVGIVAKSDLSRSLLRQFVGQTLRQPAPS